MDIEGGLGEDQGPSHHDFKADDDDYFHEVLSTDQIVQYMVESIKEVNNVMQVSPTLFRFSLAILSFQAMCLLKKLPMKQFT
jgi:hypothetical protein